MSKNKVAVIGAGPMGLSVALQLAKNGAEPIIFEADDRIGGMAAPFDFSGIEIERYYHFHCAPDKALLNLLDELNLRNKLHWVPTRMGFWYQNALYEWGNPIALLKFPHLDLISKVRYGLHAYLTTKSNSWVALDSKSATNWIKQWIGAKAYIVLWEKLFKYKFYEYSDDISAAWIWSRIRRLGRSRANLFEEKLAYIEGGSQTLLSAMQERIEQLGGSFRLSSPVKKILIQEGQVTGIELSDGIEYFSKVVSTIPIPYVPLIIPDMPKDLLAQYRAKKNIAIVCVIVKLAVRLSEYFWLNINDDEMDIPGLVEYSNLRPMEGNLIYVPFYMPGEHPKYQEPDIIFIEKVKRYLKKIKPELREEDVLDIRAHRYRFAQPIGERGYLENLPPVALPIGGLWVGDTSYYYPDDRGISESVAFGQNLANLALAKN